MILRVAALVLCVIAPSVLPTGAAQEETKGFHVGRNSISIEHQGRRRTAIVVVPQKAGALRKVPCVIMLHGAGGSTRNVIEGTGWAEVGEREGFITVFPNGTPSNERVQDSFLRNPQTWNSGPGSSLAAGERSAAAKGIDDVGFLAALLDSLSRLLAIDDHRIYVAGHSNGAAMALRFALEQSHRVAAVGVMAGHLMRNADHLASPVSLIQIIGDEDPFTPMEGGEAGVGRRAMIVPPALDAPKRWAKMLGLAEVPKLIRDEKDLRVLQWGPTEDGSEIRSIIVKGHGHGYAWPKARVLPKSLIGPTRHTLNATEEMWKFFKEHPKR